MSPNLDWPRLLRGAFLALLVICLFALIVRVYISTNTHEFSYTFDVAGVLEESEDPAHSTCEFWWLDSGGKLLIEDGIGKTMPGHAPASDRWRKKYAQSSPNDTDNGAYPQNLFRLLTQKSWDNVRVESDFRIVNDNEIRSSNRNESNGILLMSRYNDGDNLYYVGLRVDGHAVIKKKMNGVYTTLAEQPLFPGSYNGKNLLPHNAWITLRSETRTTDGAVEIILYQKLNDEWREILRATDASNPILTSGHVGIRTDFMDVEFDNFRAETI